MQLAGVSILDPHRLPFNKLPPPVHVEYTKLPPQHCPFRVLACNNSGLWNDEAATLEFVIPPAWYQTIARDLHDTLLQSFQAPLLRFQAGINMLGQRPADARRLLEDAFDRAWHAIAEGRDAIGELRMSTVEKNDLAVALKTIGKELATAQGNEALTSFQLLVEGTPRELHRGTKSTASRRGAAQCLPACGSKKRGSRNPLRQKVFPASHSR